jgi:hypothetical protein
VTKGVQVVVALQLELVVVTLLAVVVAVAGGLLVVLLTQGVLAVQVVELWLLTVGLLLGYLAILHVYMELYHDL